MKLRLFFSMSLLPVFLLAQASDLFFSEYVEGSGWNKALEIYNGTGETVDLSVYSVQKDLNGDNEFDTILNLNGYLDNDSVYVIAHTSADSVNIRLKADTLRGTVTNFNGDDQIRLMKDSIEVDRIGISGDKNFGVDVTYIRKSNIKTPAPGEQDPRSNGEWDKYDKDYFENLGLHSLGPEIISFVYDPLVPNTDQDIWVYINAIDNSVVETVDLHFIINGEENLLQMSPAAEEHSYVESIPTSDLSDGDRIEYFVMVEDNTSQQTISDQVNVFIGTSTISDIKDTDENGVMLYKNYAARIQGVLATDPKDFNELIFLQNDNAGIKSNIKLSVEKPALYHLLTVTGLLGQHNGMAEIMPLDSTSIIDNGEASAPVFSPVSIANIYERPEDFEGSLISISNLQLVDGNWPAEGDSANLLLSDGENTITMFIDQDTDIGGMNFMDSVFTLTGIIIQDDQEIPYDSGYKIMPRSRDDISVITSLRSVEADIPQKFKLYPAYPNPFNPQTTIHFDVPLNNSGKKISLSIFNISGQKVAELFDGKLSAGSYNIIWNAHRQASGTYVAVLRQGQLIFTSKLILIK